MTISSKYFDMVCYLKREAYSVPIYNEVQQNDICLEHFKLIGELIPDLTRSQCNWKENWKEKVHMKPPKVLFIRFCQFLKEFVFPLKTFRSQGIIILSWYYIPHQMWCDLLSILLFSNDRHWWFFSESVTDMYEILA